MNVDMLPNALRWVPRLSTRIVGAAVIIGFGMMAEVVQAMPGGGGVPTDGKSVLAQFVPLILIFAIFWFLMIRPQQKRAKEHRAVLAELKVGDNVITDSGIYGKILKLTDQTVTLEVASKVAIVISRSRVAAKSGKTSNASKNSAKSGAKGKNAAKSKTSKTSKEAKK